MDQIGLHIVPKLVYCKIFGYLNREDLSTISLVCKAWNKMALKYNEYIANFYVKDVKFFCEKKQINIVLDTINPKDLIFSYRGIKNKFADFVNKLSFKAEEFKEPEEFMCICPHQYLRSHLSNDYKGYISIKILGPEGKRLDTKTMRTTTCFFLNKKLIEPRYTDEGLALKDSTFETMNQLTVPRAILLSIPYNNTVSGCSGEEALQLADDMLKLLGEKVPKKKCIIN